MLSELHTYGANHTYEYNNQWDWVVVLVAVMMMIKYLLAGSNGMARPERRTSALAFLAFFFFFLQL